MSAREAIKDRRELKLRIINKSAARRVGGTVSAMIINCVLKSVNRCFPCSLISACLRPIEPSYGLIFQLVVSSSALSR